MAKSPVVGVAVGGGLSALTQVALKLAVKPDPTKPLKDQSVKVFLNRQAGAVALGVTALASLVTYFLTKKSGWGQTIAVGASGAAAALPGIVYGIQASMAESKALEGKDAAAVLVSDVTEFKLATAQVRGGFGAIVAQDRGFGGPPTVDVFGAAPDSIQLYGTHSAAQGAAVNTSAFGGKAF